MVINPIEGPLDKPVIPVVELLNSLPGIYTYASCSGHGYDDCYISFTYDNFESLLRIVKAVYSIRWEAGASFNSKKHLWIVTFSPNQDYTNSLDVNVEYQGEPYVKKKKVWMKEAWKALEGSLEKWTLRKN